MIKNMKPVLIIKLGDTMPELAQHRGDFEDWFINPMHDASLETRVADPRKKDELPSPEDVSGIILTGSHSMVTDIEDWSETTREWLPGAVQAKVPLLGVCYGHQLLADAMGGVVGDNPKGTEMGTISVELNRAASNDTLFDGFPGSMLAYASHSQSVIELPPNALLLASNEWDPHHAFSIDGCAWGIQFHPEFDTDIMKTYILAYRDMLKTQGQDVELLLKNVEEAPWNRKVLERFARIVILRAKI